MCLNCTMPYFSSTNWKSNLMHKIWYSFNKHVPRTSSFKKILFSSTEKHFLLIYWFLKPCSNCASVDTSEMLLFTHFLPCICLPLVTFLVHKLLVLLLFNVVFKYIKSCSLNLQIYWKWNVFDLFWLCSVTVLSASPGFRCSSLSQNNA